MVLPKSSKRVRKEPRSRDPSTSGTQSDSSSKKDEVSNKVPKEKIRVGKDYQAILPEMIPLNERNLDLCHEKALRVWTPTNDIPDEKLDEYITLAKEKYKYNKEQALGMLLWHKHNLKRAIPELKNFTPFPVKPRNRTIEQVLYEEDFKFPK